MARTSISLMSMPDKVEISSSLCMSESSQLYARLEFCGIIFYVHGSLVVDLLFDVLPIVCGSSVFVFVLACITLCPF